MAPVGEAVNAAEPAVTAPKPVPPAIRNITRIWYLTASAGGAVEPRRLAPVEIEPLSHYDHFSGELRAVLTPTQLLAGCVELRGAG